MIGKNDEDGITIGVDFKDFEKEAEPHYRALMAIAQRIIALANKEAEAIEDIKLKEHVLSERSIKAREFSSYCLFPFLIDRDHFDPVFELTFFKHFLGNRLKYLKDYNVAFKMKFMRSIVNITHDSIFGDISEEETQEGAVITMDNVKDNLKDLLKNLKAMRDDDEPVKH